MTTQLDASRLWHFLCASTWDENVFDWWLIHLYIFSSWISSSSSSFLHCIYYDASRRFFLLFLLSFPFLSTNRHGIFANNGEGAIFVGLTLSHFNAWHLGTFLFVKIHIFDILTLSHYHRGKQHTNLTLSDSKPKVDSTTKFYKK